MSKETAQQAIAQQLADLLASNLTPDEFTRQLFAINVEQARLRDPALADLMPLCAIPRSFDATIIGVLRDAPDDEATNTRMLNEIAAFNFVESYGNGTYAYHDTVRKMLQEQWESEEQRAIYEQVRQRLAAFYQERGHTRFDAENYPAALDDFNRAIELCPDDITIYASAIETLHTMAQEMETKGDLVSAIDLYEQSLDIIERTGDLQSKSQTLRNMGYIQEIRGDLAGTMTLYKQALELTEQVGDLKGISATLHAMANVLETRGDLQGAMTLYEQSLEIKERVGDLQGKSATLHEMGRVLVTRGDLQGAMTRYEQSLELFERVGDLKGKSATLH